MSSWIWQAISESLSLNVVVVLCGVVCSVMWSCLRISLLRPVLLLLRKTSIVSDSGSKGCNASYRLENSPFHCFCAKNIPSRITIHCLSLKRAF
ncbi:hypothetical protein EJ05DRAFT_230310 [Pseudovirgaria hyperparasitica]|uniref:Uncharacterized protein n=1 Tax=Pseudovirgaria hyperparasitica TaxID=470096 RepID=A0A6A6VT96_9PEZI|nr:uncharacterized protein EJ05DRAFT_230310 [Pseudovirgaria hyperparasitica]KAF2753016.1 hypothetical protein EJ05DRAFT_230310 [Pseudovirgaria hyperparasitica]